MSGPVDPSGLQPGLLETEIADLYSRNGGALLRYGACFTPEMGVAQDAVQEAFLRYFTERRCGRVIGNPQAWLYQVVRHFLLDRIRRSSFTAEISLVNLETMAGRQG